MESFIDTFKRKELKYRLSPAQYASISASLSDHMAPDSYGRCQVWSLYYDTPDHEVVQASLDKPLYKEKLRLRTYGNPETAERAFLELKIKYDGVVYKRRVSLSLTAALSYLEGTPYKLACLANPLADPVQAAESLSAHSLQIAREIDAFAARHSPLTPSMAITATRVAWAPNAYGTPADSSQGVRVTFDECISYRDLMAGTRLPQDRAQGDLLDPGEAVMEVKVPGSMPMWLVRALDACQARPTSFSKYGQAYLRAYAAVPLSCA